MLSTRRWFLASIGAVVCAASLAACNNDLRVSEIEPPQGTANGGEDVEIKGGGFQPGRSGVVVRFGHREATNVVVQSSSSIKVTTPTGDKNTATDVSVVFDDGKAFVLKGGFTYIDATQQRQTMDKAFNAMGGKK